jgi:hypothetical protein
MAEPQGRMFSHLRHIRCISTFIGHGLQVSQFAPARRPMCQNGSHHFQPNLTKFNSTLIDLISLSSPYTIGL